MSTAPQIKEPPTGTPPDLTMTTVIRPGESVPSCVSCRYFTGHTSWCRIPKAERTIAELTDGRELRPMDVLTLAQARRTLAWAEEVAAR